jgi:galactitol-specific phosphotransferase system IIB component
MKKCNARFKLVTFLCDIKRFNHCATSIIEETEVTEMGANFQLFVTISNFKSELSDNQKSEVCFTQISIDSR